MSNHNMLDPAFHITTPRLYLSYLDPYNDSHMSFVVALLNSPEMLAMAAQAGATHPQPQTISEARTSLLPRSSHLAQTGYGRYIVSLRDPALSFTTQPSQTYVGYISMQLQRFPGTGPTIPDIGFAFLAQFYGQGYASEACQGLMQYFTETKGFQQFAGFTHPENVASPKLFKRLEFENRGVLVVDGVVGCDGVGVPIAVWVKGVAGDIELESLGIGSGRAADEPER